MIKKYIKKSLDVYKKNLFQIIKANILIFLIPIILIVSGLIPLLPMVTPLIKDSVVPEPEIIMESLKTIETIDLIFPALMFLLAMISSIVLKAGIIKLYAQLIRRKSKIGVIFDVAKKKFLTILVANVLVGIMMFLLFRLLMVITSEIRTQLYFIGITILIFIQLFFLFVNQAIVIDNMSAFDSIKKSFAFVKKKYFDVLIIFGLFMLLSTIFSLLDKFVILFLGSIITALVITPIMAITLTYFYIKKGK